MACSKKSKIEAKIEAIPVNVEVTRFDKLFFETPVDQLPQLKQKYPELFASDIPDSVWTNKMKDPLWRELYQEVQKKFGNFDKQQHELNDLVRHIKFYFPKTRTPKVVTLINDMNYHSKALYAKDHILISLELYLGKDHKFYEFPKYLKQNFEPRQMMPDVVESFSESKIPYPRDKTLLAQMIYAGKGLYLKEMLLSEFTDAEQIGYLPEQIQWCEANEQYMWKFFIEEKLLYDSDSKLANRFINTAPFSKFYLEIDNESPGRVGGWLGWQIVRSFAKNNDVPLQQLLQMDAVEIFNQSKYKPKKND